MWSSGFMELSSAPPVFAPRAFSQPRCSIVRLFREDIALETGHYETAFERFIGLMAQMISKQTQQKSGNLVDYEITAKLCIKFTTDGIHAWSWLSMLLKVYKDEICLVKLHGKLYLEHIDFRLANVLSFTGLLASMHGYWVHESDALLLMDDQVSKINLSLHLPKSGTRSTTENGHLQTIFDGPISTYPSLLLQATAEKIGNDKYRHYDSDIATGLGVSALLVFFFIAEVCLLAALFAMPTKYLSNPSHSCQKGRKGVFRAGAAFVVLTGIVSELYYVSYSKANDGQLSYNGDTGTRTGNL
ncbi:hypothetical protein POTOM_040628 [Populus tomentosa]|uniref:Uncharacterized protein n=1 Tax=Populus tomentosa TaxID=118781 RepID=A0A8X7YRL0_POPTO|nr:hypothetical protein POTOM_040628 [Populus tomentosa]